MHLTLPKHDLTSFSAFELNGPAAQRWAQNLPAANPKQAAQQLRTAIEELNRVEMAPGTRFQIMEALRPGLKIELSNLAKHYLDQPLTLPDEPQKMAAVADALCSLCTTAYTLVAGNTLQQSEGTDRKKAARLAGTAIQRAISHKGSKILQTYQLYLPIEPQDWLELHQLYALGERQGLAAVVVEDESSTQATSIAESYLQIVLLACCKPNQLQQKDLAVIYRGLAQWSKLVKIVGPDASGLFQLDLEKDSPPGYSAMSAASGSEHCRQLDTAALIQQLKELKVQDSAAGRPGIKFDRDTTLPSNLLDHLTNALGVMSTRNFARKKDTGSLDISVGLSNTHYYLANSQDFDQVISGCGSNSDHEHANRFLTESRHHDMWEEANPHEVSDDEHVIPDDGDIEIDAATRADLEHEGKADQADQRFPKYEVQYVNSSPSGYCLTWSDDLPQNIKAGEIISVREGSNQDWIIAVTRWVSKLGDDRTLVGIELLSPSAMPYGARVQHNETRQADVPSRVLLLPEIKLIGQASTLITPRAGFKEKQKVLLVKASESFNVQLTRQVAASPGYAQFEFRYVKLLEDIITENKSGTVQPTYDSMWKNL
jgi:cyclic-di-GMP-binding protein